MTGVACVGFDDWTTFPPHERDAQPAMTETCQTCPALAACFAYADNHRIPYGTWGGETEWDRRRRWKAEGKTFIYYPGTLERTHV